MRNQTRRLVAFSRLLACVLGLACVKDTAPSENGGLTADDVTVGPPPGWAGTQPSGTYSLGVDRTQRHGGSAAAFIEGLLSPGGTFATMSQSVRADAYRGKRIRWSAWVKSEDLNATDAGLWMRVDSPGATTAFDNMSNRSVNGTSDWHQVSVVLDVSANAIGVSLGMLLDGHGVLLVDDAKLETVGNDVPSTNTLAAPTPLSTDSASLVAEYVRTGITPVNTDFEGLPPISAATVAWLASNSVSLTTTDPTAGLEDLQPLVNMVGPAHLIGLGEATHGTREFFRLKHRMLELMVQQLGATYFAIEATSPESDDMNQYVLNGVGDPHKLLSHLYFWTWNTQEVFDMIQWMRQWNTTAPASQRVQFLGFDMQYPGAAMDSVAAFITRVDPARSNIVSANYTCLGPYRNHAQTLGTPLSVYASQSASTKASCAAGLQQVYDMIDSSRTAYQAASSPTIYEAIKHDARLVQQFEVMASQPNEALSSFARDGAMAENVGWIRDHAPTGAKIVLWAHDQHINRVAPAMGSILGAQYGSDYVALGFVFGHGGFNAVGTSGFLQAWDAELLPPNSIEAAFSANGKQLALLDARQITGGGSAAAPLAGPIPLRSIGSFFDPSTELEFFSNAFLPGDYDLILFVNQTTPSTLLPFAF
jgi:erythromycin esterase-like protein